MKQLYSIDLSFGDGKDENGNTGYWYNHNGNRSNITDTQVQNALLRLKRFMKKDVANTGCRFVMFGVNSIFHLSGDRFNPWRIENLITPEHIHAFIYTDEGEIDNIISMLMLFWTGCEVGISDAKSIDGYPYKKIVKLKRIKKKSRSYGEPSGQSCKPCDIAKYFYAKAQKWHVFGFTESGNLIKAELEEILLKTSENYTEEDWQRIENMVKVFVKRRKKATKASQLLEKKLAKNLVAITKTTTSLLDKPEDIVKIPEGRQLVEAILETSKK